MPSGNPTHTRTRTPTPKRTGLVELPCPVTLGGRGAQVERTPLVINHAAQVTAGGRLNNGRIGALGAGQG